MVIACNSLLEKIDSTNKQDESIQTKTDTLIKQDDSKNTQDRKLPKTGKDKEKEAATDLAEADEGQEEDDIIKSLYHRAFSINDKIDHLLFHHNHDVMGKVAQFTPYGIHLVPVAKGHNSVDQKLKMVDYMHSMGGFGANNGFMTPYLFAQQPKTEVPQETSEPQGEQII